MCVSVHTYLHKEFATGCAALQIQQATFRFSPSSLQQPAYHPTCCCFSSCIVRSGSRSFMAQLFSCNSARWCRHLVYLLDSPVIYVVVDACICCCFFNFLAFTLVYLFQIFEMRFCIDWLWRVCSSRFIFFLPNH